LVILIGVHEIPPLVELSHFSTEPVFPESVNVTGSACPAQDSVKTGEIVPPTDFRLTWRVNVIGAPVQLFALGVTVRVALPEPGIKEGIAVTPVWLARPMEAPPVMSKTTPEGVPERGIGAEGTPMQTIWLPGFVATGVGLTVTFTLNGVPEQPLAEGVTV
jgi:hypothetical protein